MEATSGLNDVVFGEIRIVFPKLLIAIFGIEVQYGQPRDAAGDDGEAAKVVFEEPLMDFSRCGTPALVLAPLDTGNLWARWISHSPNRNH